MKHSETIQFDEEKGFFIVECPTCKAEALGSKLPYHPDVILFECDFCGRFFDNKDINTSETSEPT